MHCQFLYNLTCGWIIEKWNESFLNNLHPFSPTIYFFLSKYSEGGTIAEYYSVNSQNRNESDSAASMGQKQSVSPILQLIFVCNKLSKVI